jgi:hypothetical protein
MATVRIIRPERAIYNLAAYTVLLDGEWAGKRSIYGGE